MLNFAHTVLFSAAIKANISVYVHGYEPKFDLMDSFSTLIKMNSTVLEDSKVLQNFGITIESHHYTRQIITPKNNRKQESMKSVMNLENLIL